MIDTKKSAARKAQIWTFSWACGHFRLFVRIPNPLIRFSFNESIKIFSVIQFCFSLNSWVIHIPLKDKIEISLKFYQYIIVLISHLQELRHQKFIWTRETKSKVSLLMDVWFYSSLAYDAWIIKFIWKINSLTMTEKVFQAELKKMIDFC